MNYRELAEAARGQIGPFCKACPVCDGRACGSAMPGPGSKGSGRTATRNYEAWQSYLVNMDTIHEGRPASTKTTVIGTRLSVPVMIGPVGDVHRHYGDKYDTVEYNTYALRAAAEKGSLAFTGDGLDASIMTEAIDVIGSLDGAGIPTIKPWSMDLVQQKLEAALRVHPAAIAMDIDGAGLPFLRGQQPPAGPKDVSQLRAIADQCHDADTPFILKGIMTTAGAEKAVSAGVDAIIVSNHGGRVLDGTPASADALAAIAPEFGDDIEIMVDGGIRTGLDVFRALALGAKACIVARPFVVSIYGGGEQGAKDLLAQFAAELRDTMEMCGAAAISDIDEESLVW